jgi:hypothetical protein
MTQTSKSQMRSIAAIGNGCVIPRSTVTRDLMRRNIRSLASLGMTAAVQRGIYE